MGGGIMRTAAKAAFPGGYRSAAAEAASVWRGARPPPPSTLPSPAPAGQAGLSVPLLSSDAGRAEASLSTVVHRPALDDDWELAGGEGDDLFDAIHPAPRFVFGPVPTMEEAKEATSDLKEAIERVYLSPDNAEKSMNNNLGSNTGSSSAVMPQVPNHVVQAFSLLQGSPEAQCVVASIASDKNVWDAIMKNQKVMEFYKAHECVPAETNVDTEESVAENVYAEESVDSEISGLSDWVNSMKLKVSEIVSNISDLFQDFMGTSSGANKSNASHSTTDTQTHPRIDYTMGTSLLALAVTVILVVLLKRGA